MGHVPVVHPAYISLAGQIAPLERAVNRRRSRLPWRRAAARRSLPRLIVLREHVLYGWHSVMHGGSCPRGVGVCGIKAPPKPAKAAEPTYVERPGTMVLVDGRDWVVAVVEPRDPGKSRTL